MIDPTMFRNWMKALGTRFGKPLDEFAAAAFYEALSERLDTAGFARAAKGVFAAHRYASWPSVEEFVGAAGGPSTLGIAAAAWLVVSEMFRMRPAQWTYADTCGAITDRLDGDVTAVTCLRLIGGATAFAAQRAGEPDWARKEFLAMWPEAEQVVNAPPSVMPRWVTSVLAPPARSLAALPNVEPEPDRDPVVPGADDQTGLAQFRAVRDMLKHSTRGQGL
jgi:hypothetical protein